MQSESGPLQIAFLTGQSDPASCALSAEQGAFLRQLQGTGRQLVDCNYPYHRNSAPHRRMPLWRASLSNARRYLAARHARLADADRKRMHALLDQAPMTLLFAGSCGLQLLTALQLPDALRARLAVFADGPVGDAPAAFGRLRVVQGRSDWISRTLFDGHIDARPACGHMAYLRNAEVLAECQRFVAQIERTRQGAAYAH
ncbi:hypothetical protein [Xanthomonas axonopodis]|uniref:Alpha/beta hydrolase n=1 Tax=Xanthomonas axonopodis pv. vasculorum TaxID=325777 RepID=A0A098PYU9_9XANT|nr:hypothetical protein [Xanthomonas axonopodis]KGE51946.1 hypothetical protein GW15_0211335 [Xanthomonas axonopodis pv. vasculorum]